MSSIKLDLFQDATVDELAEELHRRMADGEMLSCPVCKQNCKIYRRKLNSGMAATLCWLVSEYHGVWIDVPRVAPRFVLKSNEHGKLVHWGLIKQKPNLDDLTKKTSGIWMPTERGILFAEGRIEVPSHVLLFDNTFHGFSEEQTTIREALGNRFNYEELMKTEPVK